MDGLKQCCECKKWKPLEAFHKEKRNADGRKGKCRACQAVYQAQWRKQNKTRNQIKPDQGEKKCTHCKRVLPVTQFRSDRVRKDGLSIWCNACMIEYKHTYETMYPERKQEQWERQYAKNGYKYRARAAQRGRELREAVLHAYGGENPRCVCCGETLVEFLVIDHINGGGNIHRKEIKKIGASFYAWLKRNNYPEGFRILCHNCNSAYGHYGYCPHTRKL